jgi:HAD superfamily hydrolase (TIGR01509 family)
MPSAEEAERLAAVFNLDAEAFWPLWHRNREAFDRGDLSSESYWRALAEDTSTKLSPTELDEVRRIDLEMFGRINQTMVDWLVRLQKAGMKTALLSNMHPAMIAYVRERFDWLRAFSFLTFSAEVRLTKPDPAIYRYTLDALGIQPAQALFVDDVERNIQAARELGITALHFQSVSQLRRDLEALGFPVLPAK